MLNKFLLILLVGVLTFSLSAQQYRRNRRNRGRDNQTNSVQQKKTQENNKKKTSSEVKPPAPSSSSAKPTEKFDPKKPVLTQKQIDSVLNDQIRERLLECRISEKLRGQKDNEEETSDDEEKAEEDKKPQGGKKSKKNAFISRLDFAILMSQYRSMTSNFELSEVTRIPPEWYQQYQTELNKFGSIINEMTIAIRIGSDGRYAAAVKRFKEHQQECLKFLRTKPPRIPNDAYQALILKNTKIRQQNYQKMLQEKLKAEREAAMRRRQELLKQRTQPKNQTQNKDQKTANKK